MQIFGTEARIEMEIPYNIPTDRPSRIFVDNGAELAGGSARYEEFPAADQYTIQGDVFSNAIRNGSEVPVPLENAVANMAVIEAVLRSGETGRWEQV
jgi:predicted dehydrogenase